MNFQRISGLSIIVLLIQFSGSVFCQFLEISEVQYSNHHTLHDAEGDATDWIELHNSGDNFINLEGYQLTDDTSKNNFWTLPDLILNPDSFLLIYASGKNTLLGSEIHSDFKLKMMKEPVVLLDPDGKVMDRVEIQCVPPDKSLGFWPDNSNDRKILSPTPGYSNNSAVTYEINFLKDSIGLSHLDGFYAGPLQINLSNIHTQNNIYYTLDGDIPDEEASLYEDYLILDDINHYENRFANLTDSGFKPGNLISKANILRAIVISEGCPASEEIIKTYFINKSGNPEYHVPVISLITEEDNLFDKETGIYITGNHNNYSQHGKAWERPVHAEVIDTAGNIMINQNAGLRIHGSGSRRGGQKSLRLYARDEYGNDTFEYPFFQQKPSIDSHKTLLLRTSKGWSRTLFKDELCNTLVQDMSLDYSATQTSILFLNGEYWGIYSLRERQDKYYVENNYNIENANIDIISFKPNRIEVEEGSIDSYLKLMNNLEIYDPGDEDYYALINDWFDLDKLIDFFCAQIYLANIDFPQNNFKMWRSRHNNAPWRFFFFDLDGTMMQTYSNQLTTYNNNFDNELIYQDYSVNILRKLFQNRQFREKFFAKFDYHLIRTFSPPRVLSLIDDYQNLYEQLSAEHIYRWNMPSDIATWYS